MAAAGPAVAAAVVFADCYSRPLVVAAEVVALAGALAFDWGWVGAVALVRIELDSEQLAWVEVGAAG